MLCDLPEDVLTEVLVRAPAETIPRLRCVSKSWKTLIDSPEFLRMRFGGTDQLIFLSRDHHLHMSKCTDSLETMKACLTKIELENNYENSEAKIIGSCNGFMCLLFNWNRLVVINPCTKQRVELPPSDAVIHSIMDILCGFVYFGFGYDQVDDDYKVVRLLRVTSMWRAKVYSLKSKRWRELEDLRGYYANYRTFRRVYPNGALHLLMCCLPENVVVVSLNLATEMYHLVPLPAGVDLYNTMSFHYLDDVAGCLGLIIYNQSRHEFDVWTMKEYGVEDSWTKLSLQLPKTLYSKIYFGMDFKLAMHTKNNIFIFRTRRDFIWYDNEEKVYDYIVSNPSIRNGVFTFTPNLNNLPMQNKWIDRVSLIIKRLCACLPLK